MYKSHCLCLRVSVYLSLCDVPTENAIVLVSQGQLRIRVRLDADQVFL